MNGFLQIIRNSPPEVVGIASSTLCNLLLDFSPSKMVNKSKFVYHGVWLFIEILGYNAIPNKNLVPR